nr:reverse transcriptase domain-containing protein [Tanacetum cinerariifolium]
MGCNNDTDGEDEEPFEDEDGEEHLASTNSSIVPINNPVPSAGDIEAFETDELEPPMSTSIEARISKHAAALTPSLHVPSPLLPLPSPLTTSLTDAGVPLGYRAAKIRMRALLPSTSHRTDIPEADTPPQKKDCLTTPTPDLRSRRVAQLVLRVLLLDREAAYTRRAWASSKDRSVAIKNHIRTLEAHVATSIAQTSSLQTQLTTTLRCIETLEARDLEPQDELVKAGSSLLRHQSLNQCKVAFPTEMRDKKMLTVAERQLDNKMKFKDTSRNNQNQQQPFKRNNVAWAYTARPGDKNPYEERNLYVPSRPAATNNNNNNNQIAQGENPKGITCFECRVQGHFRSDCPKLKNINQGNRAGNGNAVARAYDVGTTGTNPNSNVVTGTFLLNNHYDLLLFDTGVDRSFLSTAFSSLIDIIPTTLNHGYDVELADDIMPVEMGSFDVIIGMDCNNRHESRLNIISCTKTQKYLLKGCPIFLAHVTIRKTEDKSKEKRLEDVPIVQDFPEYRRFIEGFSKIAKSMTKLSQKKVKFDWGDKEEAAFQLIKQKLCSTLILALPEGSKDFIVYCDTLIKGKANVVADALSRKEREPPLRVRALVMTIGLDLPRQILNAQTEARKPENIKKEYVGELLSDYDCEIQYHPGKVNVVADALSRKERKARKEENFINEDLHGTRLDMSTAYHSQIDGQSERTIQTLKDILRACVLDFRKGWDIHLSLVEFSYNNSYHTGIKASPFEALYGRSPICWAEVGDSQITGPEIIHEMTKNIVQIKSRIQAACDCQKSYADPVEIVDREVKRLKRSRIPLVKIRWNSKRGPEFTWEREDQFRKKYPHLFARTASTSTVTS